MTILISSSTMDYSTDHVIEWIYFFNKKAKIIRVNDDKDYKISFDRNDIYLNWNEIKIPF
mgnify:CR=1 FL=1